MAQLRQTLLSLCLVRRRVRRLRRCLPPLHSHAPGTAASAAGGRESRLWHRQQRPAAARLAAGGRLGSGAGRWRRLRALGSVEEDYEGADRRCRGVARRHQLQLDELQRLASPVVLQLVRRVLVTFRQLAAALLKGARHRQPHIAQGATSAEDHELELVILQRQLLLKQEAAA